MAGAEADTFAFAGDGVARCHDQHPVRITRMSTAKALLVLAGAVSIAMAGPAVAQQSAQTAATSIDQFQAEAITAARVVDAFHTALEQGDTEAALTFLADDVLIFEGGGAERSKAEYAEHHLAADAAFSAAVPSVMSRRTARAGADSAWVASESRTTGEFNGRPIDSLSAETMVLRHEADGWRITHIHWSSHAAR